MWLAHVVNHGYLKKLYQTGQSTVKKALLVQPSSEFFLYFDVLLGICKILVYVEASLIVVQKWGKTKVKIGWGLGRIWEHCQKAKWIKILAESGKHQLTLQAHSWLHHALISGTK